MKINEAREKKTPKHKSKTTILIISFKHKLLLIDSKFIFSNRTKKFNFFSQNVSNINDSEKQLKLIMKKKQLQPEYRNKVLALRPTTNQK